MTFHRWIASSLLLGLIGANHADAQDEFTPRLAAILEATPGAARAHWGVQVVQVETGTVVAQLNPQRYFVPASNLKLYSSALALLRLGPEYRFSTSIRRDRNGDLRLVGGGDPSMSARAYPYAKGPDPGQPLAAIEAMADALVAQGLKEVPGDIVGDDSRWVHAPYPEGWAVDDTLYESGAPVGALTLNDNTLEVKITPGAATGDLARLTWLPALEYFSIDNRVRTEPGERQLEIYRDGPGQLRLVGRIAPGSAGRTVTVAQDDPAQFAAAALYEALTRRGVVIRGRAVARHLASASPREPANPGSDEGQLLWQRQSPPLSELLGVLDKVSQNLHAEMILREVAWQTTGDGSLRTGLEELKKLLAEIGIEPDGYDIRDGSGLSRMSLVTPDATVKLLRHLHQSPHRDLWLSVLPVGGVDGTLENRFKSKSLTAAERTRGELVRAKTGSLAHINTLAGYIESQTYGRLAMAIMANASQVPSAEIRATIDKLCVELSK
ncbi:MAG: D-alanyl-D-alanine carboxypeptidase/D-alanyl-D-alanine-endopeptidase [Acidobacteria bacterium]|nr:D-alanyl-D-alanine carboxypeptidase/D-alanyl-D-alanine-endopeptidase [Acidobacteriota bacterium]